MKLFGSMTMEERAREAYDTFTEEAQPYLFPEGEKDALTVIEALGEACGLRERARGPKQCEDLLDLWAEMVRCTELDQNRNERIRLMRKKYGSLVRNEATADRVCNWCEKRLNTRFGEKLTVSGMLLTRFPEAEEEEPTAETEWPETEKAVPEAAEAEMPETEETETEPQTPAIPEPGAVARALKEAWNLKGPERKQTLENLKPRRKEWIGAAMASQQTGARGVVGSIFLAGFVAAGGDNTKKTEMRDLLKTFLEETEAEQRWSDADEDWKKEALKAAWQLGARLGYSLGVSQDEGQGPRAEGEVEGQGPRAEGQVETEAEETIEVEETTEVEEVTEVEETAEGEEAVTGETEDETVWGNDL